MSKKKTKNCKDCAWYSHISYIGCCNPDDCEDFSAWVTEEEEYKEIFRCAKEVE